MSEKRRDNRNRILREGEYQRKVGGIGSAISMKMAKSRMCTAGGWIGMILCLKGNGENLL